MFTSWSAQVLTSVITLLPQSHDAVALNGVAQHLRASLSQGAGPKVSPPREAKLRLNLGDSTQKITVCRLSRRLMGRSDQQSRLACEAKPASKPHPKS